jgi:creatinine amidohydrolase
MSSPLEANSVTKLWRQIADATDEEIQKILNEYGVPAAGELDKPCCYIQTTPPPIQKEKRRKNDIVFIPLGSTEIHGNHSVQAQDLLQTSRLVEAVRRYTAKQGRETNLAYSPWVYGWHPYHHIGMIGTVPISAKVLMHQLVDVMFGLWAMGYRKQIFVNNHCGISLVIQAMNEFRYRYPQLPVVAVAVDWCVSVGEFLKTKRHGGELESDFIHADETETSIALLLSPEMLRMEWAVDTVPKGYLPDGHFERSAENLSRPNSWQANAGLVPQEVIQTPVGVVGKATLGDARKAKRAVSAALKYLTLLQDQILETFPPGKLPPIGETTLFSKEEVESYLKDPSEPGYKNPYRLWKPL